jgi:nucleoside-diphosphate-sugar epimerase
MRILVTGATGVLGHGVVPRLLAAGHDVTAAVRGGGGSALDARVRSVPVDLLDPTAVHAAVDGHEAVIHLATAMPAGRDVTKVAAWAANDRLRAEATAHLADAARVTGACRVVFASITDVYADGGDRWLDEGSPVDPPWAPIRTALDGERAVDAFTDPDRGAAGVAVRLGRLYGPGRASAMLVAQVRGRELPVLGDGRQFVSSLHADDAAAAIVAALEVPAGIYNVADDEPARAGERLDALAARLGAPRPRRIPVLLARLAIGGAARYLAVSQRVTSRRFREASGWRPAWPSVLDGWADVAADAGDRRGEAAVRVA